MIDFPHYDAAAIAAIRAVVEREVGRELADDPGFESLMAAVSGAGFAYAVGDPAQPKRAELEDAIADAKKLRLSIRALGRELPTGMAVAFMPSVRSGDIGADATKAAARADEWISGLDSLIVGLGRELSGKPQRKGRPPLNARNVFWAMLEML